MVLFSRGAGFLFSYYKAAPSQPSQSNAEVDCLSFSPKKRRKVVDPEEEEEVITTLAEMHKSKAPTSVLTIDVLIAYCPDEPRMVSYNNSQSGENMEDTACTLTVIDTGGSAFASVTLWNEIAGWYNHHITARLYYFFQNDLFFKFLFFKFQFQCSQF